VGVPVTGSKLILEGRASSDVAVKRTLPGITADPVGLEFVDESVGRASPERVLAASRDERV